MRRAFAATAFLSAVLLFVVQLLLAKMLLPRMGGAAATWTTSAAFFQAALLLGYLWAHVLGKVSLSRQLLLHGGLLALAAFALPPRAPAVALGGPVRDLLGSLALGVGIPFVALSATSPLLQRWLARTGQDPYPLSSASNLGSLLGLVAYPLAIERGLGLIHQRWCWSAAFAVLAASVLACGAAVRGEDRTPETPSDVPPPRPRDKVRWFVLALVPACLSLAVTTRLSSDVGAFPLLWAVPLALYLVTFAYAFAARRRVPAFVWPGLLPVLVVTLVWVSLLAVDDLAVTASIHLVTFFVAAMACHVALADARPPARHLTEFWLIVSAGGVAGGVLAALAPLVASSIVEWPLALAAACILSGGSLPARLVPAVLALGLVFAERPALVRERSFFGVVRVIAQVDSGSVEHVVSHGGTCHGTQLVDAPREPTTYYSAGGPAGHFFATIVAPRADARVALVGLGAGTLFAYARPGQTFTAFEIDPAIVRIAEDERFFTYLRDARERGARVEIVPGDARVSLGASREKYHAIVLDAFSGDSVPLHLLTRECVETVYLPHLADGGAIAFHVSSRFYRIAPVLGDLAGALGLVAFERHDRHPSDAERARGVYASHWVVLARRADDVRPLAGEPWHRLVARDRPSWLTDDRACALDVLAVGDH